MRPPEVYVSTEGFTLPYEDLWPFLETSWRKLQNLKLDFLGRTYLLISQEFILNGKRYERRALLCVIDPRNYKIHPHEDVFPEGVSLYRDIARHFPYQFAPIMLIGDDKDSTVKRAKTKEVIFENEFYGVKSRIYTAEVEGKLPEEMVIADGHHRFDAYKSSEVFIAFIDINDPALRILPTHRGLKLGKDRMKSLLSNRKISTVILRGMKDEYLKKLPLLLKGRSTRTLGLKVEFEDGPLSDIPAYMSDNIFLGGRYDYIAGYERYLHEALNKLYSSHYDFLLILRATTPRQVLEVARAGLKMPRKSTDFFPKLIAGPVFVR